MKYYLAIDIGASGGRHIVGHMENGKIAAEEVYRFPNGVKEENGHLVWDIAALFSHVKKGIGAAFAKFPAIESLAVDTWAVDYVLLENGEEILPCYAYRDRRTERSADKVHEKIPFAELYKKTGIQYQPFNTVYQFYDDLMSGRLEKATDFLMLPEYFAYKLTGVRSHEYTNATTTGLLAPEGKYDKEIIQRLGFPKRLFGAVSQPKTELGPLLPEIAEEVGGNTKVVLCAGHDTASAVEGIPMEREEAYLSSGTWSLLGAKTERVLSDERSRKANFSNEGGVGYIRYQKNVMGMWIVNRLREELCDGKPFPAIVAEARESAYTDTVDVNDPVFFAPVSMKQAFDGKLERPPEKQADYFNCAFRSLANSYAAALGELRENLGRKFTKLYIVGGGAKNGYLNELTQRTCGVRAVVLPIEATAIGNLKLQMERVL